ncbi:MAG: VWA domain-containing protein [Acidobacteriota bacterium]
MDRISTLSSTPRLAAIACFIGAAAASSFVHADDEVWQTIFRGSTEVNVVNIDVVVTDKEGRPVNGLTRDDFRLATEGQPTEISNFFAVEAGRTVLRADEQGVSEPEADDSTAVEPAHLILYVDNANIRSIHRARVFERLRDFLLAHRQFNARVMLVSNDRSLAVRQTFTSVPHEIFVALKELQEESTVGPRFENDYLQIVRAIEDVNVDEGSGLFETKGPGGLNEDDVDSGADSQERLTTRTITQARPIMAQIRAYSAQRFQHTQQTLRVLRQLTDIAAGLPGRKSVIYVSDGLPLRPGEGLLEAAKRRFEALAGFGANLRTTMESIRDDATPAFEKLVEHANASRVTIHTLDASPSRDVGRGSAASSGYSGGNFASWNDSLVATERRNAQDPLVILAQGTGGRFGLTHTTYEAVLQGIVSDFDNYYSLGFIAESSDEAKDRAREIEVTVGDQSYQVRYRSSFRDKTTAERSAERAQAALLLDSVPNPFDVIVDTETPQPQDDGLFMVPLRVQIPLDKLVLLPGKTEHQGKVSMFVAVRDDRGRTSEVNRHLCPIRIPNAAVLTVLDQRAACGVRLLMRAGPQRIAVSVLDELTAVDSTAHLSVDIGAQDQQARLAAPAGSDEAAQ